MRKGRFDEIFFVDLPTKVEREAIFDVHLKKRHKDNNIWQGLDITNLREKLAALTEGFVGSEIEQAIISALYDSFSEQRGLREDDIVRAIKNTVPLCVTQKEQITNLRDWANTRAVNASSKDHLSGYEHGVGKENIIMTRGGRAVDA